VVVTRSRTYQVKDAARLSGVSVRTLHHYDSIGLLVPSGRTAAGYRLYTDDDLLRLQQIVIGRELGLSLEEIRRSLDDPRVNRKTVLLNQKERLKGRVRETDAMIRAIDVALAVIDGSRGKGVMKMEELFEGFNPAPYEDEARNRWGTSDAFVEAGRRTRGYSPDDWKAVQPPDASRAGVDVRKRRAVQARHRRARRRSGGVSRRGDSRQRVTPSELSVCSWHCPANPTRSNAPP